MRLANATRILNSNDLGVRSLSLAIVECNDVVGILGN